uniref:Uncharacterized protein n=1 Tax=Palpitomonas bilix TaxID=652834 RepID=A0A7S3GI17_9EUKA
MEKKKKEMEEMMMRLASSTSAQSEEERARMAKEKAEMERKLQEEQEAMRKRMEEEDRRRKEEMRKMEEEAESRRRKAAEEAERQFLRLQEEQERRAAESRQERRKRKEEEAKRKAEEEELRKELEEERKKRKEERERRAKEPGLLGLPQGSPHKQLPPRPPSPKAVRPPSPKKPPTPPPVILPEWTDGGYKPPKMKTGNLVEDMHISALGSNLDKVDKRTRSNWIGKKLKDVVYLVQQMLEEKVERSDFVSTRENNMKALWEIQKKLNSIDAEVEKRAEKTDVDAALSDIEKRKLEDHHLDSMRLILEELSMTTSRVKSAQSALREIVDRKPDPDEVGQLYDNAAVCRYNSLLSSLQPFLLRLSPLYTTFLSFRCNMLSEDSRR